MKKKWFLLVCFLLGSGFYSWSYAKDYTVKKGDALSQIAQRELGSVRKITEIKRYNKEGQAVEIADKNLIFIGERLLLPEVKKVSKDFQRQPAVVFKTEVVSNPITVEPRWQETTSLPSHQPPQENPAVETREKILNSSEAISAVNANNTNSASFSKRSWNLGENYSVKLRDPSQAIDVANLDFSTHIPFPGEEKERRGWNLGGEVKFRPFRIYGEGWKGSLRVGPYAEGQTGYTEATRKSDGRKSDSRYRGIGGGATSEYKTFDTETGFDAGVFYQSTENRTPDKDFSSNQREVSLRFKARYKDEERRLVEDKKLFPYYEISGEFIRPLNVEYKDSNGEEGEKYAYDSQEIKIGGKAGIYDIRLDENGFFYLTPTFNLFGGRSWGKDSFFIKGGPGVDVRAFGQDIIMANFLNPKYFFRGDGSRFYPNEISFKLDDICLAISVLGMTEYTNEEEKKVEEKATDEDFQLLKTG